MQRHRFFLGVLLLVVFSIPARATIFGTVRGTVEDPQHRPISGATVVLSARDSQWKQSVKTNALGQFAFNAVPLGQYTIDVSHPGFALVEQAVTVESGSAQDLHFELKVQSVEQNVTVSAAPPLVNATSSTTETMVSRRQIRMTPGGDRANSLAMVTNYVPGSYMVHDMLHVRGGH